MGSLWWHWTVKSSFCALAVLNRGSYHKFYLGKTENLISRMSRCAHQKGLLTSQRPMKSMCLNNENTGISDCLKYLGVWEDQHLTFKYHIKMKCKMAMWNLQKLKTIISVLTTEAANTMAMSTIISHLDYCNSIYSGLPKTDLQKLQRVQNIMGKTVLGKGKLSDPTDCLLTLHWVPVKYRVE